MDSQSVEQAQIDAIEIISILGKIKRDQELQKAKTSLVTDLDLWPLPLTIRFVFASSAFLYFLFYKVICRNAQVSKFITMALKFQLFWVSFQPANTLQFLFCHLSLLEGFTHTSLLFIFSCQFHYSSV